MTATRGNKLLGAVKFLPDIDGIGAAVFIADNAMFVAEMDADFRIIDFSEFYNEQGYFISYDIPELYRARGFMVGDPAPIPVWADGRCFIIEGDAEKAKLEEVFGLKARKYPALVDLGRMLDDARSGRIKAQVAEWVAAELASSFDDVFIEPPSRTKYWVHRYRVALRNARKITKPPHPIDVRLRNAADGWLRKFAIKSEPSMLGGVLGDSGQGIFSSQQIRNILFAYIAHKLNAKIKPDLEIIYRDDTARTIFPQGLYNYFLEHGWPHVPFNYVKPDLIDVMKGSITSSARRPDFTSAVKLSSLMFGTRDAPAQIDAHAMLYVGQVLESMKAYRDSVYGDDPADLIVAGNLLLSEYARLEQLSCIMHGADRAAGRMVIRRFSIGEEEIERWRRWAGWPE